MVYPVEVNLLVSSNPANGAKNVSADGSSFSVQFQDPLVIPKNARAITISVEESTIWWVIANVETGKNDRFYVTAPNTLGVQTNFVVVIPQGLYNLGGLSNTILRELGNQGCKAGILSFSPDEATQKVSLRISDPNTSVDFTQSDTPREILGFNSQVVGPFASVPREVLADNVAGFNSVNYFVIHSDLVTKGLRLNDKYDQAISTVLITAAPGSQIVSAPFNPPRLDASELAGTLRSQLRFYLTDDQNRPVNTNGEYWSARIVLRYLVD